MIISRAQRQIFGFGRSKKKQRFIEKLNPNIFFAEKFQPTEYFVIFLRNIAEEDRRTSERAQGEKKEVAVFKMAPDWTKEVMRKVGWEHLRSGTVAAIWNEGTVAARDSLYALRERIKVSLPALKNYILSETVDLRLFEYMLEYLLRQGKIKTKRTLQGLMTETQNYPVIQSILQAKYREVKEDFCFSCNCVRLEIADWLVKL